MISIIIPFFNEEENLKELTEQIGQIISARHYEAELVFIDDGSTDNSHKIITELAEQSSLNIKIIQFRRNFGKSAALSAGFSQSTGDIIITMDADLQDDPAEIPNLINKLDEGYDLVSGWKFDRKDPITKTLPSKLFNKTVGFLSGIAIHDFNCGLKAYRKEVIDSINIYGELHRFLPVLAHHQGFKIGEIKVNHRPRIYGQSKFGSKRLINGFVDLLTVLVITKYTRKPGHFFGSWGILSFLTGSAFGGYLTILWISGQRPIGNRPLLFLGILLIIIGVQLISMGLLGELIIQGQHRKGYNIKSIKHQKTKTLKHD